MAYFRQLEDKMEELLSLFSKDQRWLIAINADPDALGSAMALRRILSRRVQAVAIAQVNEVKRPDNQAMIRYLRIPTQKLIPTLAAQYDHFALVDSQPHHHPDFEPYDYSIIIDHHPLREDAPCEAEFCEIRPEYGSTCTMLTEYLYNLKIKPGKLLATALIYGIKSDTQSFERKFTDTDVKAFRYLTKHADMNLMNRIARSEYKLDWLRSFSRAFYHQQRIGKGIHVFMNEVENPDILVVIADFYTRVHDISWNIVSGVWSDKLIVIFRGDGVRKDMGKLALDLFGDRGSAGGHKGAARAEIELKALDGADPELFISKRLSKLRKSR